MAPTSQQLPRIGHHGAVRAGQDSISWMIMSTALESTPGSEVVYDPSYGRKGTSCPKRLRDYLCHATGGGTLTTPNSELIRASLLTVVWL